MTDTPKRNRPASKPGSAYITPEGERALREELHQLWKVERPQVTQTVHEAAKNGDRSENGDYIYGKRRLREIDRRVRFLEKRLQAVKIVSDKPTKTDQIYFGAWVDLLQNQEIKTYRIVGPDEFDLGKGLLSIDAPLARKLIGKKAGDEITLDLGTEKRLFVISAVRYD